MSEKVTLLWTGGWDSTFRLLQLLLIEKISVQPIYVIDFTRNSMRRELETMASISGMVKQRLDAEVTLFPKLIFLSSDFSDVPELKDRFNSLKNRFHVAAQYYWLAVIAENQKWDPVELGMVRTQAPSDLEKAIFNNLDGDHPTLNETWEAELFKYWTFPLLTTTKSQMRDIAEKHGFIDILSKRWFCLRPVRGKCCGICRPCELAVNEGATDSVQFIHPAESAARKMLRNLKKSF